MLHLIVSSPLIFTLSFSPFTSSFISSPPVSSPFLASPTLLPLLSSAVVLHSSVHRKPICVAIPPVLTDAHRVCVCVYMWEGATAASALRQRGWGWSDGYYQQCEVQLVERREGEGETEREGERERTVAQDAEAYKWVWECWRNRNLPSKLHAVIPILFRARSLVPSRTRKRAHAHACTLHTLRHRLSSTALIICISLASLVDVIWSLQHVYLQSRRTSPPARTLTLTLLRGPSSSKLLSLCFPPFLKCFLNISFFCSLKSLSSLYFLALSVCTVSTRALRGLLSMAGSFDSHIARNMMWQCQLSQPDCRCYRVDGYSLLKRLPLHPLIGPRCPVQSVGQWLDNIGLVQYENHLLSNGFDNVQFMVSVSFTLPSLSFPVASFLSVSFFH